MLTLDTLYERMLQKLSGLMPEFEIRLKAELAHKILLLKEERGAIILGHNYMEPALYHSVPDVVGDSLELSRTAATATADPIVFCGVRFMAETAKILNPDKTVLLPAEEAGCSLAAAITAADVIALRKRFPGVPVVSYVNTYAEVKAVSDICCTSGNAARVVQSLGGGSVIFVPDQYLAANVAAECGRPITFVGRDELDDCGPAADGSIIAWRGSCEVHEKFSVQDISAARGQFPDVAVLAHPECKREVVQAADFAGSTTAMIKYIKGSSAARYLLLTECSMGDNIAAETPEKEMLRLCSLRCPHMHQITLQGVLHALTANERVITLPDTVIREARRAVERMLEC